MSEVKSYVFQPGRGVEALRFPEDEGDTAGRQAMVHFLQAHGADVYVRGIDDDGASYELANYRFKRARAGESSVCPGEWVVAYKDGALHVVDDVAFRSRFVEAPPRVAELIAATTALDKCPSCDGSGTVTDHLDGPNFPVFNKCILCGGTGKRPSGRHPQRDGIDIALNQMIAHDEAFEVLLEQAIDLARAERVRSAGRGYTVESDQQQDLNTEHKRSPLVLAAVAYLIAGGALYGGDSYATVFDHDAWPWPCVSFKPSPDDRLKELTKAAGLVLAAMQQELLRRMS